VAHVMQEMLGEATHALCHQQVSAPDVQTCLPSRAKSRRRRARLGERGTYAVALASSRPNSTDAAKVSTPEESKK